LAQLGAARGVKDRERTINFFEVVKYVNSTLNERMAQADWQEILETIREVPLRDRVYSGARTLIGEALAVDGKLHLKLMLVRDEDAWLSIYRESADTVGDLDLGDDGQLVETTIIAFLDYGNVIGLIQGSTTAPTPSAFEEWVNGTGILGPGLLIDTQPMVSHEAMQRLRESSEASQIVVKAHTNRADALEARGSKLAGIFRQVNAEYGPMNVTVILSASKARDQSEGRTAIRNEAQIIAAASDAKEVSKASAKLIYIDADEKEHTKEVDFAKQKITAKRKIPTTSEDGSPIRNESAVRVILEVALMHDQELRAIANAAR
jgi:hypothetical protein